jgi:hypothetical protein
MRLSKLLIGLVLSAVLTGSTQVPKPSHSLPVSAFDGKLDKNVPWFDTSARPLFTTLVDLAFEYQLPVGLEYVNSEATRRPLDVQIRDASVRQILAKLIAQAPGYEVSFNDGLVNVYSLNARLDASNPFNRLVNSFVVQDVDTHVADFHLFCQLEHQAKRGCAGSVGTGQWGSTRISVQMNNAKVYEILNEITARNGKAIWTVTVPPKKLHALAGNEGLWHIYPLEDSFKASIKNKLAAISEDEASPRLTSKR